MHPAYSIIFFTTSSGLGYGLMVLIGIAAAFNDLDVKQGIAALALSLILVTAGLLSSTFHLGHPERAWRALSQWRSSWLSREGVMAILTYVPAVLLGISGLAPSLVPPLTPLYGGLMAVGAVLTVYCTAKIYASLKAIPRWHNKWVPNVYLTLALATGSVWFDAISRIYDNANAGMSALTVFLLLAAWFAKWAYWKSTDNAGSAATAESATGLGGFGQVRLLDLPHTSRNYLQNEMGYVVARKHARKLRRYAVIFTFVIPLLFTVGALIFTSAPAAAFAVVSALSIAFGVVIERWLFFAEAEHAVMLYYGKNAV